MDTVTVRKDELLKALRENRDSHRDAFLLAQEGWRETIIEELDRRLADARAAKKVHATFHMPEPQDHTTDYDRIIRMVEMNISDEIELDGYEFSRFVMDDWDWKAEWSGSNLAYTQTATARRARKAK